MGESGIDDRKEKMVFFKLYNNFNILNLDGDTIEKNI